MLARPTLLACGLLAAALSCGACGKPVDLKQAVQVTDVSSGWFDAGVQNGKNKLVPSVTFKLKKNADVNLTSISLNLTFIFIDSQEHADDVYVQSVPFQGAETAPIVVRSKWGYTGILRRHARRCSRTATSATWKCRSSRSRARHSGLSCSA